MLDNILYVTLFRNNMSNLLGNWIYRYVTRGKKRKVILEGWGRKKYVSILSETKYFPIYNNIINENRNAR